MQRELPAVLAANPRNRLVVLVDDHVFAAFRRAGARDDPLPPGERGLAFVGLQAEVGRHELFRHWLEPHRLQLVVEDQRPALADQGRVVEVVEVRGEDVAWRQLADGALAALAQYRRVQRRRGDVAVGASGDVGTDGRAMRAGERCVERDETRDHDDHRDHQAPSRRQHHARGIRQGGERDERRRRSQAAADQIREPEAVRQRLRHPVAVADQMAAARGRERDEDREPEPAADLARGVHEARREPRLPLLGTLCGGDRRGDYRHRDPGSGEQPGEHDVDEWAAARADFCKQQHAGRQHHQPAAEHRAHPEVAHELAGTRGDHADHHRHRQEHEAGLER